MSTIAAPAIPILCPELADMGTVLSIFSSAHADMGSVSAIFVTTPAIFLLAPAISALKSAGFLAEVGCESGVGAFSTRFPRPGGAAFDAMADWATDLLATFASTAVDAAEVCTMATYPRDRADFLRWAEAHIDVFTTQAANIGLTPAQATAFKNQVGALRGRTTAQQAARDAAKAATEAARDADSATRELTSDLVRSIRAFATNSNNPNVYVLAQIPAPNPAAPVPPPGQPTDFKVELNGDGSITLKWKAKHPEGSDRVVYFVQRKLINEAAFRLIGGSGEKSYQDDTLPVGIEGATYIVTAQRGNVQGQPSRQLTVTFGSGGPGAMRFGFAEANATAKKAA